MAMGQNPYRTSEHPNPTAKIGSEMGGAPTPGHWGAGNIDLRSWMADCILATSFCLERALQRTGSTTWTSGSMLIGGVNGSKLKPLTVKLL